MSWDLVVMGWAASGIFGLAIITATVLTAFALRMKNGGGR